MDPGVRCHGMKANPTGYVWSKMNAFLPRYRLLENFNTKILLFGDVLDYDLSPTPGMDPGIRYHGMKANPTGYLWSKYECFLMSGCQDIDF